MQRVAIVLASTALAVAVLAATPAVQAAPDLIVPRNSVGSPQIRNGAIMRADLNRATVAWLNAGAPTPRGRGVTVSAGKNGDRIRVTGANLRGGNVLGQMELVGAMTCPNLGPWLSVEATFFDANGTAIDTGGDSELSPVAGVRYPLEVFGDASAVRAEAVASVECL
jgi:hypothetical protein